jgi:NAD-dependent dihydropyrimidine dehydrogenase PreA subunit
VHRRHGVRLQDRAGDERRPVQLHGRDGLHQSIDDFKGRALPTVTDWKNLNLNHISKAVINQDTCIQCGRCHIACEDTSHQAIWQ